MPYEEVVAALREMTRDLSQIVPNLVAAALLLLAGVLLGRLLRSWSRRLTASTLERLGRSAALRSALHRTEMPTTIPRVVGLFVFWLVFLFFAASALETLGLPVVTNSLSRFIQYLPNVLAAALILAAGHVLGTLAGGAVTAAAASARVEFAPALGRIAYAGILLIAVVVGLEEIGIDSSALIVMLTVVFGSILVAIGLAFGLGARTTVSNIIASHYLLRSYQAGQTVRIEGVEGRILETTPTAVIIATEQGRVMIPAKKFSEENSVLVSEVS